jgi:hypothetical protein
MQRVSALVDLLDKLAQCKGFSGFALLVGKVLRDLRW